MKKNVWLWIVPGALFVLFVNLAAHLLYMVLFSYVISPGQEFASYEQHALKSAPYVSFIIGFPTMFFTCWWIAKRAPARWAITAAILTCIVYILIDVASVLYLGEYAMIVTLFAISYIPYLIAAYVAATIVRKRGSD